MEPLNKWLKDQVSTTCATPYWYKNLYLVTVLVQKLVFGYSKGVESDLAPEKDAHYPKLDETLIAMPRQQLLLPSRAQQSIQNAHY